MTRAYTDMDQVARELAQSFKLLRAAGPQSEDGSPEDVALSGVETFCAVALRVMKKTNPSKVRDCARTVEIEARMDGVEVVRGAA